MLSQHNPAILVTADDHDELIELALKALGRAPGAALLLREMQRAQVVDSLPDNVLAMNDGVAFAYDGRDYRDFKLVYPNCADFADGCISVLTPVGAALIGLAEGDAMTWADEVGGLHQLTVTKVSPRRAA
jgi:regulator of nucleoside diphosphate kinase